MRSVIKVSVLAVLLVAAAGTVMAQAKVAVIDVERVVTQSDPGKEVLGKLKRLQEEKIEIGRSKQQELISLREQLQKQRAVLSDDKAEELRKEIEDKTIELKRFEDDAQREMDDARRKELSALEQRIMPVIDEIGREQGFTLIFNKFQSGLVYADEASDITDDVIRRFNTSQ